jgi:hypothetical protein
MIHGKIQRVDRLARHAVVRLYMLLWLLVAISLASWAWFGQAGAAAPGLAP